MLICLIIGDNDFDHLVKAMYVMPLHCKVTGFFFY